MTEKEASQWLACHGAEQLNMTINGLRVTFQVKLLIKLGAMILDMMFAIVYTNSPYVIAVFTDHSNYDTISNISKRYL